MLSINAASRDARYIVLSYFYSFQKIPSILEYVEFQNLVVPTKNAWIVHECD